MLTKKQMSPSPTDARPAESQPTESDVAMDKNKQPGLPQLWAKAQTKEQPTATVSEWKSE